MNVFTNEEDFDTSYTTRENEYIYCNDDIDNKTTSEEIECEKKIPGINKQESETPCNDFKNSYCLEEEEYL